MGARFWWNQKLGEGSTFLFMLPKQEERIKDAKLEANIVS